VHSYLGCSRAFVFVASAEMNPFEVSWYLLLLVLAQVNSESNIIEGLCNWTVRLVLICFQYKLYIQTMLALPPVIMLKLHTEHI
jgi:hypothetical protein